MAKHKFLIGLFGEGNAVEGAQCARCYQIVLFENGKIPDDIREQECQAKSEDVNEPAERIVREATK